MSTVVSFNGKNYIEPSVGAAIKSGVPIPPVVGSVGNVVLIDDGLGAGYGGGSGINGANANGAASIYSFNDFRSAQDFVRGGIIWDLIPYLFSPSKSGNGVQTLYIIRAGTTTGATSGVVNFVDSTTPTPIAAGSVTFTSRNEGLVGNGSIDNNTSILTRGYGFKLIKGVVDGTKFIMQFYQGDYRGADANNNNQPYDVAEDSVKSHLILQSPEFKTANDLISYMTNDYYFNLYFKITASTASTTVMGSANLTNYGSMQVLTGGTESFASTDLDDVLNVIGDLDSSLFLAAGYGTTAYGTNNVKIEAFLDTEATYGEIMFVGGGLDHTKFNGAADASVNVAQSFNDKRVVVVHSGIKMPSSSQGQVTYKLLPSIYHAALWCGRTAGLDSEVPPTYKDIRISGLIDELNKSDRELALQAGTGHTRFVEGLGWVINQGINTLQVNTNLINQDGSSPEISVIRIEDQLNKELVMNSSVLFIGTNIGQITASDIKTWVEGYLLSKVGNLIVGFQNVTVSLTADYWNINYCFFVNSPINKLFYTGVILDPNISI